jgi:hypothetical protein
VQNERDPALENLYLVSIQHLEKKFSLRLLKAHGFNRGMKDVLFGIPF